MNIPQQQPINNREETLLVAGVLAYKQMKGFRFAFYISVLGNIVMFILMNGGVK